MDGALSPRRRRLGCSEPAGEAAMDLWPLLLFCLRAPGFLGPVSGSPALDPNGKNVCRSNSPPSVLTCCPGWEQEGHQCPLPLCTGADACRQDEICVRPGLCRCRPGFFGFNCLGRCPDQYWGPDCKETCLCHPNGKCDPASGRCSCHPGWWGPLCQAACPCGPHGRCSPLTGACRCAPGWWAPDCGRPCSCNLAGSRCDPLTGRCLCHPGWWGRRCASFCSCGGSPCAQETGRCECRPGLWGVACQHRCQCLHGSCAPQHGECTCHAGYRGPSCADPCPAGTYGLQCLHSCGHCRHSEACSPVDGACLACDPGWNGTHCQQPCPPGRHGENCTQACPHCLQEEACHPVTGECQSCDAGLTGARCELPCPEGSFGFGCRSSCPTCFNGSCDPVSGACVCQAGFWGHSCNQTCPEGFHGPNCSETCRCLGAACHPLSGECQWRGQTQGALLAGILTPLLFFLLIFLCCCCCRRSRSTDAATDRAGVAPAEGDPVSRVKHHTLGALAGLTSAWPCFSFGGYRFPRVTVSHHDVELPFSPSFIEAPSAAWPSDSFSSFDTEDEDEELPPASQAPGDTELQPRRLLTTGEDPPPDVEGFAIPRTSSLAKAKRPSVSFAEGTRFTPQGLLPGPAETLGPTWRPKGPQGGRAPVSSPEQPPRIGDSPETPESAVTAVEDSPEPCYENVEVAGGVHGGPLQGLPPEHPQGQPEAGRGVQARGSAGGRSAGRLGSPRPGPHDDLRDGGQSGDEQPRPRPGGPEAAGEPPPAQSAPQGGAPAQTEPPGPPEAASKEEDGAAPGAGRPGGSWHRTQPSGHPGVSPGSSGRPAGPAQGGRGRGRRSKRGAWCGGCSEFPAARERVRRGGLGGEAEGGRPGAKIRERLCLAGLLSVPPP
ncbi:scavenger receptor class F member 1 [Pogona vitticeps]